MLGHWLWNKARGPQRTGSTQKPRGSVGPEVQQGEGGWKWGGRRRSQAAGNCKSVKSHVLKRGAMMAAPRGAGGSTTVRWPGY